MISRGVKKRAGVKRDHHYLSGRLSYGWKYCIWIYNSGSHTFWCHKQWSSVVLEGAQRSLGGWGFPLGHTRLKTLSTCLYQLQNAPQKPLEATSSFQKQTKVTFQKKKTLEAQGG